MNKKALKIMAIVLTLVMLGSFVAGILIYFV